MDDGDTPLPPAKRRSTRKKSPFVPHELVTEILSRLSIQALLRFSCVCKSWQSTISGDVSFHRAHLRRQKPCVLLSPYTYFHDRDPARMRKVGLYKWQDTEEAPLVHAMELPSVEMMHGLAQCDGLVLVPTETTVRMLNPATRRVLTLPLSPGSDQPRRDRRNFNFLVFSHQAFGLGRDPCSRTYKFARFFYRSALAPAAGDYHCTTVAGDYHYTVGMEVFTIGIDRHWRETVEQPPYPAVTRRTATAFKGSLLWIIDKAALGDVPSGFLRFDLVDETFGLIPYPPWSPSSKWAKIGLVMLRGELAAALVATDVEMWMCNDVDNPRWELHHKVVISGCTQRLSPIGVFDGDVVFNDLAVHVLRRYDLQTKSVKAVVRMEYLRYYNPNTGMLEYQNGERRHNGFERYEWYPATVPHGHPPPLHISSVNVIPYVQSLVPL